MVFETIMMVTVWIILWALCYRYLGYLDIKCNYKHHFMFYSMFLPIIVIDLLFLWAEIKISSKVF